jgi:beta-lactam-binding protein with PASTA domain
MSLKDFILSRIFLKHLIIAALIASGSVLILLLTLNIYTRHGQANPVPDFYGLTVEETEALAKKSKMKFQINDSVYTAIVPRGCIAEQHPKPGFRVKKWRKILLTINAFRPEMVTVPDLINLPLRQANSLIEGAGLVVGKKTYKPDLSIDIVLSQLHDGREIAPHDSLQKGSVIDLVLGKGLTNQATHVPDLTGMRFNQAKDRINGTSLNLGAYNFDNTVITAEDSLNAFVYKQNPEYREDATIQYGSSMYLWFTIDSLLLPVDSTLIVPGDTLFPGNVLI